MRVIELPNGPGASVVHIPEGWTAFVYRHQIYRLDADGQFHNSSGELLLTVGRCGPESDEEDGRGILRSL